ncbi:MAG: hypothetical protein GF375_05365 [Candidatus Omnitrophica bacterium]|nr:hypothetical protein [Candidatus Omnitrophota bacterium]MBD3269414.1 hypothetical protein [Candidatus Omnitrophota bacterium]
MNLKDEIAKLVNLQEIDSRIYELSEEKDRKLPGELSELKDSFEHKKKELSSAEERLKDLQLQRKNKELDLNSKEENMRKAQGQLYQLKTNKEYQAKLNEITSSKADISLVEEELLRIMEDIESEKGKVEEEKKLSREEEKKYNSQEKTVKDKIREIEAQINDLKSKRKRCAEEVDAQILTKYEKLIKSRGGLAIVPVKNNNCGACYMNVNHQKVNEIKMYGKLVLCESCVRILYIPEDLEL